MAFAGRDFKQADVESALHAGPSRNLLFAGIGVAIAGVTLISVVASYWDIIAKRSLSAAVQGLTASIGVTFLGLALLYASRGRGASAIA
jgi:hypothetical protein